MNLEEINLTADRGSHYSLSLLAWMKAKGVLIDKDVEAATNIYRKLAGLGVVEAMHDLGELLLSSKADADDNLEAVAWLEKAADREFAPSQYFLGYCCENGIGRIQDIELAATYYEQAALSGHIHANVDLANLCNQYDIKTISKNSALYWYLQVADRNGSAAYALGGFYEEGTNVEQDNQKAFEFYLKASELGNYFASSHLEMVFETGSLGKEVNEEKAKKYALIAVDQLENLAVDN